AAVRVLVYRPGKELAREYSTTLRTTDGKATGSFPLALNDPSGEWSVVATDAISGKKAVMEFRLD
ncbi:MAG: hypothetical protein GY953_32980, partial [bacterium]|nr:hypothetical protein [bacterium]